MNGNTTTEENSMEENSMLHDEFWHRIADNAADRVEKLFSESGINICDAIGKDTIENYVDAKKTLAYILCHADTSLEKACAILSIGEWLHACNEIHNHRHINAHKGE